MKVEAFHQSVGRQHFPQSLAARSRDNTATVCHLLCCSILSAAPLESLSSRAGFNAKQLIGQALVSKAKATCERLREIRQQPHSKQGLGDEAATTLGIPHLGAGVANISTIQVDVGHRCSVVRLQRNGQRLVPRRTYKFLRRAQSKKNTSDGTSCDASVPWATDQLLQNLVCINILFEVMVK